MSSQCDEIYNAWSIIDAYAECQSATPLPYRSQSDQLRRNAYIGMV